jgi:hypothetical protein
VRERESNKKMTDLPVFLHFTKYYYGYQVNDEMDGEYIALRKSEKY